MKYLIKKALLSCFALSCFSTTLLALANPASQNCIKERGKLEIRKTSRQDQYGVCVWSADKKHAYSECEEWALFRGTCKKYQCAKWHGSYDSTGKYVSHCVKKI
jgi:putative hemolysin